MKVLSRVDRYRYRKALFVGFTPSFGLRSHATTYWQTTPAESGQDARNEQFARTVEEIGRPDRVEHIDPEKAYGIERLKKLGATVFEGSTDPADVENLLNMLEKCFDVMNCPKERKVRLATFLLQKEAEGWWKPILARHSQEGSNLESRAHDLFNLSLQFN
ncbi:uncharacterized protein E5676_scaffold244G00580 [Cucumis melo var. makuwa]|uniref:Uncharacterized protein n=1 Tax=Cucumis melo var. makuwa TaxID=1194695 RepID=A0A5D3DU44_CUCMM|nr:uncharacterized protein E5676_scaffold244G00580 [Cucumis melo var. makuwa]